MNAKARHIASLMAMCKGGIARSAQTNQQRGLRRGSSNSMRKRCVCRGSKVRYDALSRQWTSGVVHSASAAVAAGPVACRLALTMYVHTSAEINQDS